MENSFINNIYLGNTVQLTNLPVHHLFGQTDHLQLLSMHNSLLNPNAANTALIPAIPINICLSSSFSALKSEESILVGFAAEIKIGLITKKITEDCFCYH